MLKQRVITAIIALAGLALVLFVVPPLAAEIVIAAVILAGAWEWSAFLKAANAPQRVVFVAAALALIGLMVLRWPEGVDYVLQAALLWWSLALIWAFFFPTPIPDIVRWLAGLLVLVPLYVALVMLYERSPALLLFALLIVWAADIGAYFVGKRFGRLKLAPRISPGKTWEGVLGGLLLVALLALVTGLWVDADVAMLIPFSLGIACISIVGDLTVSMFKRTAGVKDSGTLFPGHGGVLDRIDSVAAAAPVFVISLGSSGLIP